MFYNTYLRLCEEKGKSVTTACREMGISANAPKQWEEGSMPRIATLKKMAEYFGVPLAVLLEREPDPPPVFSPIITESEMRLVAQYRHLTDANKEKVQEYIEFLTSKQPKEKRTVG
jgi:transcriptional regulator with XRE-family HTH domain